MLSKLSDLNILHIVQENRGLIALNGIPASPEQHRDLVGFREIGIQYCEAYVKYYILRDPSAMKTFNVPKKKLMKVNLKERQLISRCLRKQLA